MFFRFVVVGALMALGLLIPSLAEAADELSTSDRLDDRRYVTAGPRAYDVGTEAGRYPAMASTPVARWAASGARR